MSFNFNIRYTIEKPNIIDPDVRVVDYVGLKSAYSKKWFDFLNNNFPLSNPDISYRKKNLSLTVIYSFKRINYFPIGYDLEGDYTENIDEDNLDFRNPKLDIMTDPYNINNLILTFDSYYIGALHMDFISKGAEWTFEEYKPSVIIESNTQYKENDLGSLTIPENIFSNLRFNFISYSRFGENLKAFQK